MWNEIKDINDLMNFMETVEGFHDSCIKELGYISGLNDPPKIVHRSTETKPKRANGA